MRAPYSQGRSFEGVWPSFAPANSSVWKYSSGWWKPSLRKAATTTSARETASQRATRRRQEASRNPERSRIKARNVMDKGRPCAFQRGAGRRPARLSLGHRACEGERGLAPRKKGSTGLGRGRKM